MIGSGKPTTKTGHISDVEFEPQAPALVRNSCERKKEKSFDQSLMLAILHIFDVCVTEDFSSHSAPPSPKTTDLGEEDFSILRNPIVSNKGKKTR